MTQGKAILSDSKNGSYTAKDGHIYATATFFVEKFEGTDIHQYNAFAFSGDAKNCLEIHLSKPKYTAKDEALFHAELELFRPDSSYVPVTFDYFAMATLLFNQQHEPQTAAVYYQAALNSMTASTPLTTRRVVTDQLVMSYGMSGDLKQSQAVAQQAIAKDPDYPLNYYNLACADAEAGNATAAREHLKQAYDRRAHVIQGEKMPDPTTDDSIMKLKNNKEFWSFVQSLPRS
jgi:tetratricopeptide (TPR) repeat protein